MRYILEITGEVPTSGRITNAKLVPITYYKENGYNISKPSDEVLISKGIGKALYEDTLPSFDPSTHRLITYYEEEESTIFKKYELEPILKDWSSIQSELISNIKSECESIIIRGFDFDTFGTGLLHYTLEKNKQDDMKVIYSNILAGATKVLWHDSSRVTHEVYTAEQFINFYQYAMYFVVQCKIRSDFLEQQIIDYITNKDEASARNVNFYTPLSDEIEEEIKTQVSIMTGTSV